MTIASPAAHVQQNAPLKLSPKAMASMLSMLTLASSAALALTLAPLKHPRLNNQNLEHDRSLRFSLGSGFFLKGMQYENNNLALYDYEADSIFGSGYKKIFVSYLTSINYEILKGELVGVIKFKNDEKKKEIYIIGVTDNKILIKDEITDQNRINEFNAKRKIGCYIATCVYGSYDCPQVWTLRRFRDNTLAETMMGRAFIRTYYAISPTLVKWVGNTSWFKKMWKGTLDRMVSKLQANGVEDTPYQDREW